MYILDRKNKQISHYYQNIIILKELQKCFGNMYFGWGGTTTDELFIISNIRIDFEMYATGFKELFFIIL